MREKLLVLYKEKNAYEKRNLKKISIKQGSLNPKLGS